MSLQEADHLTPTDPYESAKPHFIYQSWEQRQPYYIVVPKYVRTSAGIKALHLLAHALNKKGYPSWVLIYPYDIKNVVCPDLLTPVLTDWIIEAHYRQGLNPIVVYPETIEGNPFNASCVARYVLNFPGLLGGDGSFDSTEFCFGYSASLAEACGYPERVLFIPASDPLIFHPPDTNARRSGTCYYYGKYQDIHEGEIFGVPADSIEISRKKPGIQTPRVVAEILRKSELLYVFENTALATEAVMCGCPVVFMPNPWLTEVIATKELGWDGMAWGDAPEEIERARQTVTQGAGHYLRYFKQFWKDLEWFIEGTQAHAAIQTPATRLYAPHLSQALISTSDIRRVVEITLNKKHHDIKTSDLYKLAATRLVREVARPFRKVFKSRKKS